MSQLLKINKHTHIHTHTHTLLVLFLWRTLIQRRRKEETQINNIRKKIGDVTMSPTYSKKIISKYYEQLYRHKFDN